MTFGPTPFTRMLRTVPPERSAVSLRHLAAVHHRLVNEYLAAHKDKERQRASLHLLLGALLSHCSAENIRDDGRAVCWVSLSTMAGTYGFDPRHLRRMLRELEQTGALFVLYGSAVSVAVQRSQPGRQLHGGGFTRWDGTRVPTPRRAHQFVFAIAFSPEQINGLAPVADQPSRPAASTPRAQDTAIGILPVRERVTGKDGTRSPAVPSLVPRLPPDKRAEIDAEIGATACAAFIAWVTEVWGGRAPIPPRPYDFWNARLPEWRERAGAASATARAEREIAATAQHARDLRAGIAATAADRVVIAADIRRRLATFPTERGARG